MTLKEAPRENPQLSHFFAQLFLQQNLALHLERIDQTSLSELKEIISRENVSEEPNGLLEMVELCLLFEARLNSLLEKLFTRGKILCTWRDF